jgi:capsular exopolysaccharide synthesis family protein
LGASVAIVTTASIWVWTLSQKPIYEGQFQLLVEPVTSQNRLDKLTQITQEKPGLEAGLDYDTQIQVLRSPQILQPIVQSLKSRHSTTYEALLRNFTIVRLQDTKILEIRYRDDNAATVKLVLDQLSQSYLNYSLQERQSSLRQGIQFVENQLSTLQTRVNKLQEQLQNFRQRYSFIDPELQAEQLAAQSKTIADQKLETRKQLAETEAIFTNLQGNGAAPALRDAVVYQRLLGQLRDVETKIATESARFSGTNPAIANLQDQRQNLVPLLRQEARQVLGTKLAEVATQLEVLQVRSQAIAQAEARMNQQMNQLPAISRQYADLQRELKVASESLNRFLATRETLQVDSAQKEIPWQLIAAPQQPGMPISPNIPRNGALGLVTGILLGIAVILLAERLDNTFHSLEMLKEQLKLPVLGVIPFDPSLKPKGKPSGWSQLIQTIAPKRPTQTQTYAHAAFVEAFRSLHANIRMLSSDQPIRSLVISSALPSDGKSTIAVQLAIAAAAMGQRVLLVDADLRQPRIADLLNLPNLHGLSTLINTKIDFNTIVHIAANYQPDSIRLPESLFVLTSGQNPPDSIKLLSSQKMQLWMEKFCANYDLVIYDTPPLLGLADSSLLAPYTDGVLLAVGMGRTDRTAVFQAIEALRNARISILGLVANGSKHYTSSVYGYYHRYYTQATQAAAIES